MLHPYLLSRWIRDNFGTHIWSLAAFTVFRKKSRLLCNSNQAIYNQELVDLLALSNAVTTENSCCAVAFTALCLDSFCPLSLTNSLLIHQIWKFPQALLQKNDFFNISKTSHMYFNLGTFLSSGWYTQDSLCLIYPVSKSLILCFDHSKDSIICFEWITRVIVWGPELEVHLGVLS